VPCQIGGLVDGRPVTGRGPGGSVGGSPDIILFLVQYVFIMLEPIQQSDSQLIPVTKAKKVIFILRVTFWQKYNYARNQPSASNPLSEPTTNFEKC
jgi:hypothetical protein